MRLKPPATTPSHEDPFAVDLLERREVANSLTEIVKNELEGLVISLHAPWGQGKTTFLQMWQHQLVNAGFKTIYFNAWETDFSDNALVALIGELSNGIHALRTTGSTGQEDRIEAAVQKIKGIGATLLRKSIPFGIKIATSGLLELDDSTEEALYEFGQKVAEDKIKAYEESRNSIKSFREAMTDFATEITVSDEARKPLIVIVDELDRCRPDYSIRILECIKHLFSVPGVVFILAVDKIQLGNSVLKTYGSGIDAPSYLRRFFDIDLTLPEPSTEAFTRAQFERFGLQAVFAERVQGPNRYDKQNLEEGFSALFKIFSCSLRDQEKSFSLLSLALRSTPSNYYLFPEILTLLIILKIKRHDLYSAISKGAIGSDTIIQEISNLSGGREFLDSHGGVVFEAILAASVGFYNGNSPSTIYAVRLEKEPTNPRLQNIVRFLADSELRPYSKCLKKALSKIDLVS